MGKLWGSRSHYDKNGDGRLNSRERTNWYFGTYGADIEMSERKKVQQDKSRWTAWLDQALEMMESSYSTIRTNAGKLLGYRASEELTGKTFIYWITCGILDGSTWDTAYHTNTGMFVSNETFFPTRSLVKEFIKRHHELGSYEEAEDAVRSGKPLYEEAGKLTGSDCGLFWRTVIDIMPPYYEDAIRDFDIIGSYTPYDNEEDTEKAGIMRQLMWKLFSIYSFFAGSSDTSADQTGERYRKCFLECWKKYGIVGQADEEEESED